MLKPIVTCFSYCSFFNILVHLLACGLWLNILLLHFFFCHFSRLFPLLRLSPMARFTLLCVIEWIIHSFWTSFETCHTANVIFFVSKPIHCFSMCHFASVLIILACVYFDMCQCLVCVHVLLLLLVSDCFCVQSHLIMMAVRVSPCGEHIKKIIF